LAGTAVRPGAAAEGGAAALAVAGAVVTGDVALVAPLAEAAGGPESEGPDEQATAARAQPPSEPAKKRMNETNETLRGSRASADARGED